MVSGEARAVDRAVEAANGAGARRAVLLPVTGPFHSSLMAPASERFAPTLAAVAIREPEVTFVSSITGTRLASAEDIRAALEVQFSGPVRWFAAARHLAESAPELVVQAGPGSFLTGTLRRIEPRLRTFVVDDLDGVRQLREAAHRLLTPR